MKRLLATIAAFLAGAAAMAWYLTRWHDDREPLQAFADRWHPVPPRPPRDREVGWNTGPEDFGTQELGDEPGGGWQS